MPRMIDSRALFPVRTGHVDGSLWCFSVCPATPLPYRTRRLPRECGSFRFIMLPGIGFFMATVRPRGPRKSCHRGTTTSKTRQGNILIPSHARLVVVFFTLKPAGMCAFGIDRPDWHDWFVYVAHSNSVFRAVLMTCHATAAHKTRQL
jgi:hypothetical protein